MITFLSNRMGDFFLLLGAVGFLSLRGWLIGRWGVNFCFSFLVAVACFTKRAQVPLRVWLPMAMRAPTPIRALVHSRTLVTAGLFLAIKLQCLLSVSLLFLIGALTMVVAGRMRILEIDLKKIVALSTLSQLGLLIRGVGAGAYALAFFHMVRHAFTKRALLIVVGVLLHKNWGSQDKRLMGWEGKEQRYSFFCLVICCFSLCGMRFTRGAVRKEFLLLHRRRGRVSFFVFRGFLFGVALTLIYCLRLVCVSLQCRGEKVGHGA